MRGDGVMIRSGFEPGPEQEEGKYKDPNETEIVPCSSKK